MYNIYIYILIYIYVYIYAEAEAPDGFDDTLSLTDNEHLNSFFTTLEEAKGFLSRRAQYFIKMLKDECTGCPEDRVSEKDMGMISFYLRFQEVEP